MASPDGIDYFLIGHVCQDITPDGPRLGGTVSFCALVAQALGLKPAILTSAPDTLTPLMEPISSLPLVRIPSEQATTFENVYTPSGRVQKLSGRAAILRPEHVPEAWRSAPMVHLAPVAAELDPALASAFPDSLVCVTPQGWMRRWDTDGHVSFQPWQDADRVLQHVSAVVMSIEDVAGDENMVASLADRAHVLVVTRGSDGCTVYNHGESQKIAAPRIQEVDPTGAGDIFATSFFFALYRVKDPLRAAQFAVHLASDSVTRSGMQSIPSHNTIQAALRSL
jgi:sugar/nucleoside kinase (ribokinase family)